MGLDLQDEIRQIVNERRDYEYKLVGRSPKKVDYLNYITYELKLESLRKIRKKKLGIKKSSSSDYVYLRRIHFIFDRALRRFRYDLDMWMKWVEFSLRTNSSKALQKIFPRALRLLPHCEKLWLKAASWEFDVNHNISGARHFMQRAIRFNPLAKELWLHYFKLEILYIRRLQARRLLLGVEEEKSGMEEDIDNSLNSVDEQEAAEQTKSNRKLSSKTAFFEGLVPRIIYNNAVSKIPEIEFCISFWRVLREFRSSENALQSGFRKLQDYLLNDITEKFPLDSRTWMLLAENCVYHLKYLHSNDKSSNSDKHQSEGKEPFYALDSLEESEEACEEIPPSWSLGKRQLVSDRKGKLSQKKKKRKCFKIEEYLGDTDATTTDCNEDGGNLETIMEAEENMMTTLREALNITASPFLYKGATEQLASRLVDSSAPKSPLRVQKLIKCIVDICLQCHNNRLSTVETHMWLIHGMVKLQQPLHALQLAREAISPEYATEQENMFEPYVKRYVSEAVDKEASEDRAKLLRPLRVQANAWILLTDFVTRFRGVLCGPTCEGKGGTVTELSSASQICGPDFQSKDLQELKDYVQDLHCALDLLKEGINTVSSEESLPLWLYLLGLMRDDYAVETDSILSTYLNGISRCGEKDYLRNDFLQWIFDSKQLSLLEKWKKEAFGGTPSLEYYLSSISRVEILCKSSSSESDVVAKCQSLLEYIFSRAISDHGTSSAELWLKRIRYLQENGKVSEASHVYERAMKELSDPSDLLELCSSSS